MNLTVGLKYVTSVKLENVVNETENESYKGIQ